MAQTAPRTALVVIDVQAGSFENADAPLHDADRFLSRTAELISEARAARIPVLYTQYLGSPGSPLEAGTPGGEVHAAIEPAPADRVVRKDDSDGFLRSDLHEQLQSLGIDTLVVCGLQTEFCVDATCRTAYGLGYEVVLVEDAHTTVDTRALSAEQIIEHHNRTLSRAYVTLASTADVRSAWKSDLTASPGVLPGRDGA